MQCVDDARGHLVEVILILAKQAFTLFAGGSVFEHMRCRMLRLASFHKAACPGTTQTTKDDRLRHSSRFVCDRI